MAKIVDAVLVLILALGIFSFAVAVGVVIFDPIATAYR